jgi:DNA-binding NarL/FixJ family response regulator
MTETQRDIRHALSGRSDAEVKTSVAPHTTNVAVRCVTDPERRMIDAMASLDLNPTQDEVIRVFVVDDHGMVRRGVCSYLSIFDDIEVVGEAANGRQALERLTELAAGGEAPDVVLMDLAMEPIDGVAATRELRATLPDIEIVAVTSLVDQSRVQAALEAGASGYLVKDAAPEELALAIRAARRGEIHLDAAVARRLMDSLHPSHEQASDPFAELSEREHEVLRLIAEGHANKAIARRLVISERTARTHVSNILRKLGLSSRTQAALLVVREGLGAPTP